MDSGSLSKRTFRTTTRSPGTSLPGVLSRLWGRGFGTDVSHVWGGRRLLRKKESVIYSVRTSVTVPCRSPEVSFFPDSLLVLDLSEGPPPPLSLHLTTSVPRTISDESRVNRRRDPKLGGKRSTKVRGRVPETVKTVDISPLMCFLLTRRDGESRM